MTSEWWLYRDLWESSLCIDPINLSFQYSTIVKQVRLLIGYAKIFIRIAKPD